VLSLHLNGEETTIRQNPCWKWGEMGDGLNRAIFSAEAMQMRQVLLHPGEDGYWVVECPSLPGCVTQGKSKEEALENIKEAIRGYVESLRQDGLPVPDERFDALLVAV
jgi:predicted RNase H-like HicB family nuclease